MCDLACPISRVFVPSEPHNNPFGQGWDPPAASRPPLSRGRPRQSPRRGYGGLAGVGSSRADDNPPVPAALGLSVPPQPSPSTRLVTPRVTWPRAQLAHFSVMISWPTGQL